MKLAAWLKAGKKKRAVRVRPIVRTKIANETVRRPSKQKGHPEIERIIKRKVRQTVGYECIARQGKKVWRATAATEEAARAAIEAQLA